MNLHDKDENLYDEKTQDKNKSVIEEGTDVLAEIENKEIVEEQKLEKEVEQKENIKEIEKEERKVTEKLEKETPIVEKNEKKENNNKEKFKVSTKKPKSKKKAIIIAIIFIILTLAMFCMGFALININNTKIISGISVNGINIEGLTKEEAIQKLTKEYEEILKKEIYIKAAGFETSITGEQIEAKVEIEQAVEQAYQEGRKENIFGNNFRIVKNLIKGENITANIKYNGELLETVVSDVNAKIPNAVIENSYEKQDEKLIITKGQKGNSIDTEELKKQILLKLQSKDENNSIALKIIYVDPGEINIDKIYSEVHTEPKDAYYTTEPFQIFPHVEGVDFDLEKAKELLKEKKDSYEIELTITKPEITTNKIGTEAFPNLLSSFSTKYDPGLRDRSANLRLATEALDGTVVMPGEIFSYNKTLGERTVAKGYKPAAGYAGGKVVQTLGGGICQVSSTVYDAAVYANLEIIERYNHAFLTSYIGAGKDATVVYGNLDFKFKNTRNHPIMIKASATGGIAKVEIYGIKEETEYEIEISSKVLSYISYKVIYEDDASLAEGTQKVTQNGMNGCKSITYKIYKLNGVEVKRETLSTDTYDAMNKYILRGTPSQAVVETVAPIEEIPQVVETPQTEPVQAENNNTEEPSTPILEEEPTSEPIPESTPDPIDNSQSEPVNNAA